MNDNYKTPEKLLEETRELVESAQRDVEWMERNPLDVGDLVRRLSLKKALDVLDAVRAKVNVHELFDYTRKRLFPYEK